MTRIPSPHKTRPDQVIIKTMQPGPSTFFENIPTLPNLTTTMPGHPLAKLAYTLSQPTEAGHALILGFPTQADAIGAHNWLFDQIAAATIPDPCAALVLAKQLGETNRKLYGGGNTDYLDAIEMLVDCSDAIAAMGGQLARHQAEIKRQADILARARVLAPLAFHVMEQKE